MSEANSQDADNGPVDSARTDLARDEALLRAIAGGDKVAFESLVRLHLDAIHAYLFRLTGSRADAEDLAQETFLRVWLKADTYQRGRVRVTTWLHTIAHRLAIDRFRKKRELAEADTLELIEPGSDPAERRVANERQHLIDQSLNELPERQRSALLLCQVKGFSNAEAAEILGIRVRALESLIARARKALRESLTMRGVLASETREAK